MLSSLLVALTFAFASGTDPNFKNIFKQTTSQVQNVALDDLTGAVPKWLSGDFVRQNCASFGNVDGKQKPIFMLMLCYQLKQTILAMFSDVINSKWQSRQGVYSMKYGAGGGG